MTAGQGSDEFPPPCHFLRRTPQANGADYSLALRRADDVCTVAVPARELPETVPDDEAVGGTVPSA